MEWNGMSMRWAERSSGLQLRVGLSRREMHAYNQCVNWSDGSNADENRGEENEARRCEIKNGRSSSSGSITMCREVQ